MKNSPRWPGGSAALLRVGVMTLALFLCGGIGIGVRVAAGDGPEAVLPESRFVFPTVVDGTEVVHDFILRNTGTAILAINNVRTG